MRITSHPILGPEVRKKKVDLVYDGKPIQALEGDTILAALLASGVKVTHYSNKSGQPRGLFCGIGRCTDCVMIVNGEPNVRTCVTLVEEGMRVETQFGRGKWNDAGR